MTDDQMRKSKKAVDHRFNGSFQEGPDLTKMVKVEINDRTSIWVHPDKAAGAKERYLAKLAIPEEPKKRGRPKSMTGAVIILLLHLLGCDIHEGNSQGVLVPFPGEDVRMEVDTMNRLGMPVNYLCIQARVDGGPAYLRLEADKHWNPTRVLHIHTCLTKSDTCRILFDGRGYYNGCSCGGSVTVTGLP